MKSARRPVTFKNLLPLKPYFVRNRWKLAAGVFCLLAVDILQLFIPRVIKRAVDDLTLLRARPADLLRYGLIILAIALLVAVFRYTWRYLIFGHSREVERDLRERVFRHLQTLSMNFFNRTPTGDLMARSVNDMDAVRFAVGMGVVAFNDGVILGLAAIGFMFYIHPTLTLLALIPMPALVFVSRFLTRRMHSLFHDVQRTFGDLTERAREAFSGIRVIQAYNREEWEEERIRRVGESYIDLNVRLGRTMACFYPMMLLFTNVSLAVVLSFGGRMAILGRISTGDFVAFIAYLGLLTWPMMALGWVTNLLQRGSASMGRINRLLEERAEITEPSHPLRTGHIRGGIQARAVGFRYPGETRWILKDLSFEIAPGSTVALVGRTGCGKTTLARILSRMVEVTEGVLWIDAVPIDQWPLDMLRRSVGVVPQEASIFSDTVYNNVVLGRERAAASRLQECLAAVELEDTIRDLPEGVHTLVGEKGVTLSGGQRQRVALARALLGDPPVLVLDNALSMVDAATERRIFRHLVELRKQKTNIWISHRLSVLRRADRILVLDRGRIVEAGDHAVLLKRGAVYPQLYRRSLMEERLKG